MKNQTSDGLPSKPFSPLARSKSLVALAAGLTLLMVQANATISTGDALLGDRSTNLIANGSFETGNAGVNTGWTPGSHLGGYPGTEVAAIPSWSSSYPAGAYGWWGPLGFQGGASPNGSNAVYFGNSFNKVGVPSSIAANGVITFTGSPTFSDRPGPVTLSQTVTGLDTTATYRLDFWTSGEGNTGGFIGTGLFGLSITGLGLEYLLLPSTSNSFGASQRYYVDFTPTSSTTTFSFINWGHITDMGGAGGTATELVLDDVILNKTSTGGGPGGPVPDAGSTLLFLGSALVGLVGLRNRICRK